MHLNIKKALDLYIGSLFIIFLRPITIIIGKLLRRDHNPTPRGDIAVIKMLGGGSLVIALPALLAIKKQYPQKKLKLITTKPISSFAKTLHIFDEILIIDDSNFLTLCTSSLSVLFKIFKIDTVIDYEVYSRLTTIFALFTCARNRIGFYREDVKSRKNFSTHLIYFNLYYGSWYFYEEISKILGCSIPSDTEVKDYFINMNKIEKVPNTKIRIAVGHGCSDLSPERMLSPDEWKIFFEKNINKESSYEILFLGGNKEGKLADEIIEKCHNEFENVTFSNKCGAFSLSGSISKLYKCDEFWGIDSALLHYARLLGIKVVAFFGPTSPHSLIKNFSYSQDKIYYKQVPCSPCVHVTETPPCQGKNVCIHNLFENF